MVSVRSLAGLLMVYVIGIIGFVGGSGVGNWLRLAWRLTCMACVVVWASDSESELGSESLSLSVKAVGEGWVRDAGLGK